MLISPGLLLAHHLNLKIIVADCLVRKHSPSEALHVETLCAVLGPDDREEGPQGEGTQGR